jgi:hypothetical protein
MSILHYDKLSKKRQQLFLEHPEEFICQEKVDGSTFQIDIEEGEVSIRQGRFNVYEPTGWDFNFWTTDFREAHTFLKSIEDQLVATYGTNAEIKAEILSVNHPNTIQYDQVVNRIVVFHPDDIGFYAEGQVKNFQYPSTDDGIRNIKKTRTTDWQMTDLKEIPSSEWLDTFKSLEAYDYETLLDKLVRGRTSMFGPTKIEGLVFRHNSGWQLKLVDRAFFTTLNTHNQGLRRKLMRSSYMRDMTVMDIHTRDSTQDIVGASYAALASIQQHFDAYLLDPQTATLDEWVHARNLEAVLSLRDQLNGIINGR